MSAPTRRVNLIGDIHQICAAFGIVAVAAYREPNDGVPTLMVGEDKVGTIVGKGGANLQYVRTQYDVQVKVERDVMVDPATGVRERVVMLIGDSAKLGTALFAALGGDSWRSPPTATPNYARAPSNQAMMARMAMASTQGLSPSALSHVSPPVHDPEQIQLQVYIDDKLVGAIVGKEGATIKQTAALAGCTVCVTNRDMGPRRVVINGGFPQVMSAQKSIFEQMRAASANLDGTGVESLTDIKTIYLVRKEAAGAVIGKQGSQLAYIREQSQANIKLDKEEVQGHRPCTIYGSLESVMLAAKFIFETSSQVEIDQPAGQKHLMDFGASEMPVAKRFRPDSTCAGTPPVAAICEGAISSEVPTNILVPSRLAGAVIGKQGSNLNSIRETCDIKIKMLNSEEAPQWPTDRVVQLVGPTMSKQAAVHQIYSSAFANDPDAVVLKILVPKTQAGAVIGKQGSNLRSIREQTGIAAHLERDEGRDERMLTATGTFDQVANVAMMVLSTLDGQGSMSDSTSTANVGNGQMLPLAFSAPHASKTGGDLTQYYANGAAPVRAAAGYGTFGMGQSQATTADNSAGCEFGDQYGGGLGDPFSSGACQFGGANQVSGGGVVSGGHCGQFR
eukprot:TRINITY_DN55464_c0_g1_i1.p1 TRINITY_DN55464_c0_g1~~TRINITY_DN55464_c0_g1_i1.p1  ORF type:complete len:691 (-),score=121.04 TRINITY_DN55464_c0_g1_i1:98-1954(-)